MERHVVLHLLVEPLHQSLNRRPLERLELGEEEARANDLRAPYRWAQILTSHRWASLRTLPAERRENTTSNEPIRGLVHCQEGSDATPTSVSERRLVTGEYPFISAVGFFATGFERSRCDSCHRVSTRRSIGGQRARGGFSSARKPPWWQPTQQVSDANSTSVEYVLTYLS
eukprot:6956065-Prymnesium_polylepis.2